MIRALTIFDDDSVQILEEGGIKNGLSHDGIDRSQRLYPTGWIPAPKLETGPCKQRGIGKYNRAWGRKPAGKGYSLVKSPPIGDDPVYKRIGIVRLSWRGEIGTIAVKHNGISPYGKYSHPSQRYIGIPCKSCDGVAG